MLTQDKKQHFIVGLAIGATNTATAAVLLWWFVGTVSLNLACLALFVGLCSAFLAGGIKEALDDITGRGVPEWADLWYTLYGGIVGSGPVALVAGFF